MARDQWLSKLSSGEAEAAWDLLIDRYHRLIRATIRYYVAGYDDEMDLFAYVCTELRANDFKKLRKFAAGPAERVRFSTWLVAVVRNLVIDWFRKRDGRPRLRGAVSELPEIEREAFVAVFVDGCPVQEAYELVRARTGEDMSYGTFLRTLATAQMRVADGRPGHLIRELSPALPRRQVERPLSETAGNELAQPASQLTDLARRRLGEQLSSALDRLPTESRLAVLMYCVEGLPAADVARLVGWPDRKSVYNRVYRALADLRGYLQEQGVEPGELA